MVSSDVVLSVNNDVESRIANLISLAGEFSSKIYILAGNRRINAKSLLGMMNMITCTGEQITVTAEGEDEEAAVKAIVDFLTSKH